MLYEVITHIDVAIYDSMVAINDMLPFMWSMGLPPVMCSYNFV